MRLTRRVLWILSAVLLLLIIGTVVFKFFPSIFGKVEDGRDASIESFPVLIRTNGGLLEVGTIRYRQTYRLKNAAVVLGRKLPFCAEEAFVTIDPHITYRVRLAKRWKAEYRVKTLYVTAPALEPALPVAFDTARLSEGLTGCWFMLNMDAKGDLLRSLSATLAREATSPTRTDFARDHGARDTVREFVQKWLVTQKGYDVPANTPIDVAFRGE